MTVVHGAVESVHRITTKMLNSDLKLKNIFSNDIEHHSMRVGFGEGLIKAAESDRNVVGLCADLSESTQMITFKQRYPERFVQVGVAEQNLVTVASGMAAMGKIPFITSYAVFSPGRNWEQVRTTVCYNNMPVKIVSSHFGVSVGPDGGSHQALEDIAITRVLPRMVVISPCDAIEARKAAVAIAKTKDPTYMRISRENSVVITTNDTPFTIGKAEIFYKPRTSKADVAIIATGPIIYSVLHVAQELERAGKSVIVVNLSTIKPLDVSTIVSVATNAGAVVTVEEHQTAGGMGGAVAECLASHKPVPIEFVGVNDRFGQSGTPVELIKEYGLSENDITKAVDKVLQRKR